MNNKKLLRGLFLGCMLTVSLFASEKQSQFEIVPFDYEDASMKDQICSMIRDDYELAARIHKTEEEMREYLSGTDLENKTNCFVCRALDDSAQIYGFMICAQYDITYWSRHPLLGLWFSFELQTEADFTLFEIMKSVGFIAQLAVHKDYRGKGVGLAMLTSFQEQCKESGMQRLMLFVDADNDKAVGAYRKFGFEIDERYNDNIEDYTMMKLL